MRIEIELTSSDRELVDYFNEVDAPARPWVAKQLVKLGIQSGVNPYTSLVPGSSPKVSKEPDFSYSNPKKEEKVKVKPVLQEPEIKSRELTQEEKIEKLNGRLRTLC